MGWFHLTQLLASDHVAVNNVIEPWFLGKGRNSPGSAAFITFQREHPELSFLESVEELPFSSGPLLALIAGRTHDAPELFASIVAKGATHVYIEKPGAQSAVQLEEMIKLATRQKVAVVVGYNKNVARYTLDCAAAIQRHQGIAPTVTLQHCNAFKPGKELLDFMCGPGREGMVHNMCCHELALMTTIFGVNQQSVQRVVLDADSKLVDLGDGSSDWEKLGFTLELDPPANISAAISAGGFICADQHTESTHTLSQIRCVADRCGGNWSALLVDFGDYQQTFRLPDATHEAWVANEQRKDPNIRSYFLQQAPDYQRVKNDFVRHIAAGKPGVPAGVVDLHGALRTLQLADMLATGVMCCAESGNSGGPWTWSPSTGPQHKKARHE